MLTCWMVEMVKNNSHYYSVIVQFHQIVIGLITSTACALLRADNEKEGFDCAHV